jgi:DNA-binding transcriptional ArsR family regulator
MKPHTLKGIKILSNEKAVKILKHINDNQPLSVTNIFKKLGYEQSETSSFLKKLRDANHVTHNPEGKNIFYSIDKDNIKNTFEGYMRELINQ